MYCNADRSFCLALGEYADRPLSSRLLYKYPNPNTGGGGGEGEDQRWQVQYLYLFTSHGGDRMKYIVGQSDLISSYRRLASRMQSYYKGLRQETSVKCSRVFTE